MYEEFRMTNHHDLKYPMSSFEKQLKNMFNITEPKLIENAKVLLRNGVIESDTV